MKLVDNYNRVHDYLRISLTDRCNYNCTYCNPNKSSEFAEKDELLSFEELLRLIDFFASELEFKKFRFTGGEPLIRKGLFDFFEELKSLKNKYGFTTGLTTNGSLIRGKVKRLKNSGIDHLNISLDSLNQTNFNNITGVNELNKILEVIDESIEAGFTPLKINTVVINNINNSEVLTFVDHFKNKNVNLRFIEFMPFGSNIWERDGFIAYSEMIDSIKQRFGLSPVKNKMNSVTKDYKLLNHKAKISFITSISEHFCGSCNRVRILSKGDFRLCLFSEGEHRINFKQLYKENYSNEDILELITKAMKTKWEKHPSAEELSVLANNNMMTIGG